MMQKRISLGLCVLVLFMLAACATAGKKQVEVQTVTYETAGMVLEAFKNTAQAACSSNVWTRQQCTTLQAKYNEGVVLYKKIGDVQIDALRATTPEEKAAFSRKRAELLVQLTPIVNELQKYTK